MIRLIQFNLNVIISPLLPVLFTRSPAARPVFIGGREHCSKLLKLLLPIAFLLCPGHLKEHQAKDNYYNSLHNLCCIILPKICFTHQVNRHASNSRGDHKTPVPACDSDEVHEYKTNYHENGNDNYLTDLKTKVKG